MRHFPRCAQLHQLPLSKWPRLKRSAHPIRSMQSASVRSRWLVKARALACSQHSKFTRGAAPDPAAFVSCLFAIYWPTCSSMAICRVPPLFPNSQIPQFGVNLAFKPASPLPSPPVPLPPPSSSFLFFLLFTRLVVVFLHTAPLSHLTPPSPSLHTGSACQEADERAGREAKLPVTCHLRGQAETKRHVLYCPFSLQA